MLEDIPETHLRMGPGLRRDDDWRARSLRQFLDRPLRPTHRKQAPAEQAERAKTRQRIGGNNERPVVQDAASLRIRASTLVSASIVRIRIRTMAMNKSVNPKAVNSNGQRISGAIFDPLMEMDCP